jgi:phenylacetic acid degradation operon negative regulatory protein
MRRVDVMPVAEAPTATGGPRPRALIVTIYGLYAREAGGWLSVGTLISLLAELGVDEPAVRSSISRLKRRDILLAQRRDGAAGYALSAQARRILDEGDRRIFEPPRAVDGEGWLLAVFSVPESQRQKRHTLRTRLSWLGYGTVSAGVWVAPGHLEPETRAVLDRHGLTGYVDLFRADYLGFADLAAEISTWWDLDRLQGLYAQFLTEQQPVLRRWRRRRLVDDAEAFADYVRVLTAWRHLPFLDPGLPPALLPRDWRGARAADLFLDVRRRLAGPAHRHVQQVVAGRTD